MEPVAFRCLAPGCGTVTPLFDDLPILKCARCGSEYGEPLSRQERSVQMRAGEVREWREGGAWMSHHFME